MQRRVLGAILLPLPFAALPVVVVLAAAALGSNGDSGNLARETVIPIVAPQVAADNGPSMDGTLARVSQAPGSEAGCNDYDLRIES